MYSNTCVKHVIVSFVIYCSFIVGFFSTVSCHILKNSEKQNLKCTYNLIKAISTKNSFIFGNNAKNCHISPISNSIRRCRFWSSFSWSTPKSDDHYDHDDHDQIWKCFHINPMTQWHWYMFQYHYIFGIFAICLFHMKLYAFYCGKIEKQWKTLTFLHRISKE